jgi:hypothetical protein
MPKYYIEGGIDFYSELYNSLDIEDTSNDFDNICLITNQQLTDKHVIMNCGHKFNYLPIFYDIVNHKHKFNKMESISDRLKLDQIRCPYCRKKQNVLLPYYQELGLAKVPGVNCYYPNATNQVVNNSEKCAYKHVNNNYDPNKPESDTNIKYLINCQCGLPANHYTTAIQLLLFNNSAPPQPIIYGDNNPYCYNHKKIMVKHYKLEEIKKAKEEKQKLIEEKQKLIEEKQKLIEEKQKLKEEKQKLKEEKQKLKEEKLKSKEEKLKLKEEVKKAKEEKLKSKEEVKKAKEEKLKSKELEKLKSKEEQTLKI